MKRAVAIVPTLVLIIAPACATTAKPAMATVGLERPRMTNLIKEALAEHEDQEVVISHVVIPANFELPGHYHPGQEFIYVQDGTVTLRVKDKPDTVLGPGEVFVVPPRAYHTAIAGATPVTGIVFRVHDKGKPVRYIVTPTGEEIPLDE